MIFQNWKMSSQLPTGNLKHFKKPSRAVSIIKLHKNRLARTIKKIYLHALLIPSHPPYNTHYST